MTGNGSKIASQIVADLHEVRHARVNARHKHVTRKVHRTGRVKRHDTKLERVDPWLHQTDASFDRVKQEILSEMNRSLQRSFQDISHIIDLYADDLAYLNEKLDLIERRVERMDAKTDNLSLEFLAHRLSPQSHKGRSGYRLIEVKTGQNQKKPQ